MVHKSSTYRKIIIRILFLLSIFSSLIYVITVLNPSLIPDESFTMGLIHHNYYSMIHLCYFDVHPPLYYILLKTYLYLTTFWTKSIIIKIFFSKIFSILLFLVTFCSLIKIEKYVHLNVKWPIQMLAYIIIISTIVFSLQIRMYEMSLTFISVELLYLIKFNKSNYIRNLFIAIIFASMASYTHYFSAMFAGSLILVLFIKSCYRKNIYKICASLLSGIMFLILFIPCFKFAHRQLIYTASSNYSNNTGNISIANHLPIEFIESLSGINFHSVTSLIFGIIISFSLIYFTVLNINKVNSPVRNLLKDLIFAFVISIICPIIFSLINHPIIQGRYFYPLISIYEFILIGIIINNIKVWKNKFYFISVLLISLSLALLGKSIRQIQQVDLPSLLSYKTARYLVQNKRNTQIYLNGNKNNIAQESVYMSGYKFSHRIIVHNMDIRGTLGSNNKYLINHVFDNMNINNYK